MSGTPDLFGPRPRRKPRVLMHVTDILSGCCGDFDAPIRLALACRKCGHTTEAVERKRQDYPCPVCNAAGDKLPQCGLPVKVLA